MTSHQDGLTVVIPNQCPYGEKIIEGKCQHCGNDNRGTFFQSMDKTMEYCSVCMNFAQHRWKCYQCVRELKKDNSDGWHDDIKWIKYSQYSDELVTCWKDHLIDEAVEADCS